MRSKNNQLVRVLSFVAFASGLIVFESSGVLAVPESLPRSPADGLRSWQLRKDFEVELVASEPMVMDPTAIDWGADGKLWVVEMADYPSGGGGGGRVRFLEDSDGDGYYDTSTVFLDGLNFPNGVLAWRGGVLVTAAPEIFYAEDTNGDGRADVKKTLYSGFLEVNQQLRVNGLRRGLDNWIHCASGSHHGGYAGETRVRSNETGEVLYLGSRDFRIEPGAGLIDPLAGPSQFGRNRDDWGHWFGVQNGRPLWHYVLEDRYTRRNRHFAPPDPRRQLFTGDHPEVFPAKKPQKRFHSFNESGRFTSACSGMIYRDALLFPRSSHRHGFTCEPFHNLVQHYFVIEEGVSFRGERDPMDVEHDFLASTDRWSRPVMVRTGPDGALWVVDMYRYFIEHPRWVSEAAKKEMAPDLRAGEHLGRLYRVFPAGKRPDLPAAWASLSTEKLVERLGSPNGPIRDSAQALLIDRHDPASIPKLVSLAENGRPLARLHALSTLDGLNALELDSIQRALADGDPRLRRIAVRLSEAHLSGESSLARALLERVSDADPKVRLQLACSLGELDSDTSVETLLELASRDAAEPHLEAAVLSSLGAKDIARALHVGSTLEPDRLSPDFLAQLVALGVAEGKFEAVVEALSKILAVRKSPFDLRSGRVVVALDDALEARGERILGLSAVSGTDVSRELRELREAAQNILGESSAAPEIRRAAVPLLLREPERRREELEIFARLLRPQSGNELQEEIVRHLATRKSKDVAVTLLAGWSAHGPALRKQILRALSTRSEWIAVILDSIESGALRVEEIDASSRRRLLGSEDESLRSRIDRLLERPPSDRAAILKSLEPVLSLSGEASAGKKFFVERCATCHRIGSFGHEVGPDLVSLSDRSAAAFLESIVDPTRAVEPRYVNYTALTKRGEVKNGMLISETGTSLTLLAAEGERSVVLRKDLERFESSGKSLMPDGLEAGWSHQNLADLIAYLATLSRH